MSRIIAVYNPFQKISNEIVKKIEAAEKFIQNQTHQNKQALIKNYKRLKI